MSGSTAVTLSTKAPTAPFSSKITFLTGSGKNGGSLASSTVMVIFLEDGFGGFLMIVQSPSADLSFISQEKYGSSFSTKMVSFCSAFSS